MSHARQQIRDAFVTAVTGLTTTGARVYSSRLYPLADENLPGLNVLKGLEYIDEEEGKLADLQFRKMEILVSGYDKLISGLPDQLDTIAAEVETAVFNTDFTNISTIDLISTEIEQADGAEKPVGQIILTFSVQYMTALGAPTVKL